MEKLSYHPKNFIKMKSFGKKKNFCTSITERIASKMHQNTLLRKLDFSITIFFARKKNVKSSSNFMQCSCVPHYRNVKTDESNNRLWRKLVIRVQWWKFFLISIRNKQMHIKDITCTSSASQKMGTNERKTIKNS